MDNRNSFTYKTYSKNKWILRTIHTVLLITVIWIVILFFKGIAIKGPNLFGIIFLSMVFSLCFIPIKSLFRQNKMDRYKNYNTWGKGAGAELGTGRDLEKLGSGYKIIPDFSNGKGNIDFIVVCSKGIFTIEVKAEKGVISYNDGFYIDGKKREDININQAQAESLELKKLLYSNFNKTYEVQGIFEFRNAKIDESSIHGKIDYIWIGGRGFYNYVIERSVVYLTKEEIQNIYNFLTKLKKVKEN